MSYLRYNVNLSDNQKKKLANAIKNGKEVAIRLSYDELTGPNPILITSQQQTKINKAKLQKKGAELKFSKTQLSKQGGFLPFLAAAIPALIAAGKAAALGAAGAAGAASVRGIVDAVQKGKGLKVLSKKATGRGVFLPGKR
jgi:hypothetical protein